MYFSVIQSIGGFIEIVSNDSQNTTNQMVKYYKDRVKQDFQ